MVLESGSRRMDLVLSRERMELVDSGQASGGRVIDAGGCWVFPGLINAHEHLEFGAFGRCRPRRRYADYREWAADLQRGWRGARLRLVRRVAPQHRTRCAAWRNRRAGVTTVAHHNPISAQLRSDRFPVRVVLRLGWFHSHGFGAGSARRSLDAAPPDGPWVVHLAEGTSDRARWELDWLEDQGCLGPRTVVVHGVALGAAGLERLERAGTALVWCPSSNLYLYGQTLDPRRFPPGLRVALGTDSALTARGNLLDELCLARELGAAPGRLLQMVTETAADVYRLGPRFGRLASGAAPDLVVAPRRTSDPASDLCDYRSSDLKAVLCRGQ